MTRTSLSYNSSLLHFWTYHMTRLPTSLIYAWTLNTYVYRLELFIVRFTPHCSTSIAWTRFVSCDFESECCHAVGFHLPQVGMPRHPTLVYTRLHKVLHIPVINAVICVYNTLPAVSDIIVKRWWWVQGCAYSCWWMQMSWLLIWASPQKVGWQDWIIIWWYHCW